MVCRKKQGKFLFVFAFQRLSRGKKQYFFKQKCENCRVQQLITPYAVIMQPLGLHDSIDTQK